MAAVLAVSAPGAAPLKTRYTTVDLIAEQASIPADGGVVTLGFHIEPDPTWHAYWSNPGDAGKGPSLEWILPDGFTVGEFAFPPPHVLPFSDLNTYAYEEAILLLADLQVPPGLKTGDTVSILGRASWVVCDDRICVPDRAGLSLRLKVGDGGINDNVASRFVAARARIPESVSWPASYTVADNKVEFTIAPADIREGFDSAYLFVNSRNLVKYGTQSFELTETGLHFVMDAAPGQLDSRTEAILTWKNTDGVSSAAALNFSQAAAPAVATRTVVNPASGTMGFLRAAIFAFIGGVILNLMPCVFPILGMKSLSLAELGGRDRSAARESGVIYTIGILVAFAITAGILLALRSAGEAAGWGFQMQNPLIVIGLGLLMVAVGMNLFGTFEFGTRIVGAGQGLTGGSERRKAFFTGLLAVVVATPCMAPFMAAALGYALTQPATTAVAVFLLLGLGLALPYLALSFVPALGRMLPKPGKWMETFKCFLAFPMMVTALWLFWILGRQLGATSMFVGLLSATALAFALWAYGGGQRAARKAGWHAAVAAGVLMCVYMATQVEAKKAMPRVAGEAPAGKLGGLDLERFDPNTVRGYIADGQPTFVYFTADWCISCKVNERVALSTDRVAQAFNSRGIKVIEGDWTTEDPAITEWLEMYGRAGVPLYLYFPSGSSLETATILPQILTSGIVVDSIARADVF